MNIVPATAEILEQFYGHPMKTTVIALAAVEDGRALCIGGVRYADTYFAAFGDATEEMREKHVKTGVRLARNVVRMMKERGLTLYAKADPKIEPAERFLGRLGFVELENGLWQI